jgi:hypothetical protein
MAEKTITESTRVNVYNNVFNAVSFSQANGRRIRIPRNGGFKQVTVEDLEYLLGNAPAMLTEGILYIKEKEIREYLDIEQYYKDGAVIASDNIDRILKQSANTLKKTIKKASPSAKKEIAKRAQSKAKDLTGAQVEVIEKETKTEVTDKTK